MEKSKKEDSKGYKEHGIFSWCLTLMKSKWECSFTFLQRLLPRLACQWCRRFEMASWEDTDFFQSSAAHAQSTDTAWAALPYTKPSEALKTIVPTGTLLRSRQNSSLTSLASKLFNLSGGWNTVCLGFLPMGTSNYKAFTFFSSKTSTSNASFYEKKKL